MRVSREAAAALALLSLLLSGSAPSTALPPPPSTAAISLSISVFPPTLPADGNTYSAVLISLLDVSKQPTVAPNDTTVLLTSSLESVGVASSSVTIRAGSNYAIANFTTTKAAGQSVVTAASPGLLPATGRVRTVVATGYPTRLTIAAVPGTVLARPSNYGRLIIELQDDLGLPAKAIAGTTISLYSSNTKVVNVTQQAVTMRAGDFIQLLSYTSGFVPGTAFVTASASGYDSGSTTLNVLGLAPLALKLYVQPNPMVMCVLSLLQSAQACKGRLVVALIDLSGNPTRAPRDIVVQLRSTNTTYVSAPQAVVISAGNISATTYFITNRTRIPLTTSILKNGVSATITASAPGLKSDFAQVSAMMPLAGSWCKKGVCGLKLFVGPNPVVADHRSYSSVVVAVYANSTLPIVNSTSFTRVTVTSSVTGVGTFSSITLRIPQLQFYNRTLFTSTFLVGTTQLTASAQNIASAQANLNTFGPVPSKVVLKSLSPVLPADGISHPALQVMVEDTVGSPAVAPFDVPVNISSSRGGIVRVSPVIVRGGQTFAVVNVTTGTVAGTANITAYVSSFTSGYALSTVLLNTVIPSPSVLAAYASSAKVVLPVGRNPPLVAVQLQDDGANPARARQTTKIAITSSNTSVIAGTASSLIGVGQNYALVPLNAIGTGTTQLTVSTEGLASSLISVTVLSYPLQISISTSATPIFTNQTATVFVNVIFAGKALAGVPVKWTVHAGSLSTPNSTTNKRGESSVTFIPAGAGVASVTSTLSSPAFGSRNLTATIPVQTIPVKSQPGLISQLLSFPYVLALGGGIMGGVVGAIVMLRRRRTPVEGEVEEGGLE